MMINVFISVCTAIAVAIIVKRYKDRCEERALMQKWSESLERDGFHSARLNTSKIHDDAEKLIQVARIVNKAIEGGSTWKEASKQLRELGAEVELR